MCRYTKVRWTGGRRTVDAVGLERWRFCWVSGFASSPNRYLWCCVVLVVPRGGGQDSTMAKNSMALCLPAHPSVYGSSALRTGILNYLVFFTYFTCDMFISVCWLVDCTISAFSTTSNWPHSEKKHVDYIIDISRFTTMLWQLQNAFFTTAFGLTVIDLSFTSLLMMTCRFAHLKVTQQW